MCLRMHPPPFSAFGLSPRFPPRIADIAPVMSETVSCFGKVPQVPASCKSRGLPAYHNAAGCRRTISSRVASVPYRCGRALCHTGKSFLTRIRCGRFRLYWCKSYESLGVASGNGRSVSTGAVPAAVSAAGSGRPYGRERREVAKQKGGTEEVDAASSAEKSGDDAIRCVDVAAGEKASLFFLAILKGEMLAFCRTILMQGRKI